MLNKFLSKLNPDQYEAVTAPDGPALILAGAGSGKTRALVGRVLYLLAERKISPSSILVMTFTNKAAKELQSRLQKHLGDTQTLPWAGTFHSFCARLLRLYGQKVGLSKEFTIYDTEDSTRLLTNLLAEKKITKEQITANKLQGLISFLKNGGTLSGRHPNHHIAEQLWSDYDNALRNSQAVDFDDLLRLPLELLQKNTDIREQLQRKYEYILIDEFQDTNKIQYDLSAILAAPQNNIFVVGDDDQSIYGWRGAESKNMLDFKNRFEGTRIFRLEQNYRSSKAILTVANDIIAHNKKRNEKTLWTENDEGQKVILRYHERSFDEAHDVVKELQQLVRKGLYKWGDFAILYRANHLSRQFEDILINEAIPYTLVGGVRYYHRKEVKDLLAYLRIVVNPNDEQGWRRALRVPPKGIGEVTIQKIENRAKLSNKSIGLTIDSMDGTSDLGAGVTGKLAAFVDTIHTLREEIKELSLSAQVDLILQKSGLREYYEQEEQEEDEEDRLSNLAQLIDAARERSISNLGYTLPEFLSEIALVSDMDDYDQVKERVNLMSVHSAKGLEFPVVFITCLEERLFPNQHSLESADQIEEERRLFYVGVTRAQELLYLTYSKTRSLGGMVQFQEPSRFLGEINPEHLQGWTLPNKSCYMNDWENDNADFQTLRPTPNYQTARRTITQDIPTASIPYKIGDQVEHPEFGLGIVTAKSGDFDNLKVRVSFEGFGSKLLAIKYAPLKKID